MKKSIFIFVLILFSIHAMSQQNMLTLSGGWASAKVADNDKTGTGWTLKGLWEINPQEGNFAHGVCFGYVNLSSTNGTGINTTTSTINSFPIYYAPKMMFGKEKVKFFVKGALGMQYAGLKREGAISLTDSDFGFYGGAGTGLMLFVKENIFLNAEYELAWASNTWYNDGWISTLGLGIGFKF